MRHFDSRTPGRTTVWYELFLVPRYSIDAGYKQVDCLESRLVFEYDDDVMWNLRKLVIEEKPPAATRYGG
jgi:hypothetical protein